MGFAGTAVRFCAKLDVGGAEERGVQNGVPGRAQGGIGIDVLKHKHNFRLELLEILSATHLTH